MAREPVLAASRPHCPRSVDRLARCLPRSSREWAYVATYTNSAHRQAALQPWMHRHNHHRPHSALGYQLPISRIPRSNVSNLNS
ncbi:MAG TPA: integrase core domain-containing protein [Lysobacter sp.]